MPGVAVVGLGFASYSALFASYMIPMDLVIEDIEEVTRAKVVRPLYAGKVQRVTFDTVPKRFCSTLCLDLDLDGIYYGRKA